MFLKVFDRLLARGDDEIVDRLAVLVPAGLHPLEGADDGAGIAGIAVGIPAGHGGDLGELTARHRERGRVAKLRGAYRRARGLGRRAWGHRPWTPADATAPEAASGPADHPGSVPPEL